MLLWIIAGMVTAARVEAQISANGVNYVNTYKELAIEEEQRTGVPAAITLAQGLHETEAGTSELVRNSNNHFGIKCKEDWKGPVYHHDDDARGECFRVYATAADSYRDHSDFLRQGARYAFLFKLDPADYEQWAYGLKQAGYATNVRYARILIKLINDYHLEQYTLIATGKMAASDEVVLVPPGGGPALAGGTSAGGTLSGGTSGGGASSPAPAPVFLPEASTDSTGSPYPQGEFMINRLRVVYVPAGTPLLSVAIKYDVPLGRLYEYNEMQEEDVLAKGQLIFLQRKRTRGGSAYHVVKPGEDLYGIAQAEGIRLSDLLEMNQLPPNAQPAAGEKVYLQHPAPERPKLLVKMDYVDHKGA